MESEQTTLRYSLGEGLKGRKDSVSVRRYTSRVPHGEPYAGKLHVRFDEGYPQSRRRVAKRCTSRGADVPCGGVPLYSTPFRPIFAEAYARPQAQLQIETVTLMHRINAKSQAVTGEPGRAGSIPIAPAATTPQPAGRSIAKSPRRGAGILRGGGGRSRLRRKATAWQGRRRAVGQARHDIGTA